MESNVQGFPAIRRRLQRAQGHLARTIEMLSSGRPCLDVAQQLDAVENAIESAKKALIKEHLQHCLQDQVGAQESEDVRHLMREFEQIAKYL